MITPEREAEILRLYNAEKWRVGTIAKQLGHHHTTVRRVLEQGGVTKDALRVRPSIADPYAPLIIQTLEKFPDLCAESASPDGERARLQRWRGSFPAHCRAGSTKTRGGSLSASSRFAR